MTPDLSSVGDLLSREAQHDLGTRNRHPASKHSPHNRTQNSECVASLGEHKGNEREREREREIERGRQNKRRKGRREQNKKGQNEKERETNTKKEEGDGDAGGKWND